ncbi:mitochondrial inner membrane protease subunit 1-like [Impatiens glandulifera]|uniref:mitochondrial inner membrane protease subunit 1-like n=1 Tax=Impatiens glandulifera TaxID=253017 RepID=UPI001FB0C250|nr:mitochondrial inner membrane protease subunit 1-like [Impatiens glandulifera]
MSLKNPQLWIASSKEAWKLTFTVAKFFCAIHVVDKYICSIAWVHGPSMLPTFNLTGNLVLVDRISTRFGSVGSGDVVIVRSPVKPTGMITKRLLGLEGESVNYVLDPKNSDERAKTVVPKEHVWIEGDNIYASRDSRLYGAIPYGLLQGKVVWKLWPPEDFGSVARRR